MAIVEDYVLLCLSTEGLLLHETNRIIIIYRVFIRL